MLFARFRHRGPHRKQVVRLSLLVGVTAAALLVALSLQKRLPVAHAATPPVTLNAAGPAAAASAGSFQPSEAQWAALGFETAAPAPFDVVATVEGSVMVNDNATVNVFSPYSGRVTSVTAVAGQVVRRGAPLFAVLAVEAAQAASDVAGAAAAEITARKQFELAQRTEKRQRELWQAEAGAEKDWLQSQSDLVAAEGTLRATVAAAAATRDKVAVLGAALPPPGQAAQVTASADGMVVQRQVAPGQFVNSLAAGGNAPLMVISDLRRVWVVGYVAEADLSRVAVGQPVEISGPGLAGPPLRARVSFIASLLDPATRRVAVRAEVDNAKGLLKPQQSVTLRLLSDNSKTNANATAVLAVPRRALVYDGPKVRAYVVSGPRMLTARELAIGRVQGEFAEVTAGLKAGERVLTRGALFIDRAANDDGL